MLYSVKIDAGVIEADSKEEAKEKMVEMILDGEFDLLLLDDAVITAEEITE